MRLGIGSLVVLLLAVAGPYLWLDRDRDPPAESASDGAIRIPSNDKPSIPDAGSGVASPWPGIADDAESASAIEPVAKASGRKVELPSGTGPLPAGEVAIQWANSGAEAVSDRMMERRGMLLASGLADRSLIPGERSYDGSLAYATPIELQQKFETEVRDQEWARTAERQAERFLESHPFRTVYGSLALECKATLCRFAAVADGATMVGSGPAADWQQVMYELERDPSLGGLWEETRTSVHTRFDHPGQAGFVTWLRRRQPPPEE